MARLTTLGVKFSYAVETVKGTKPAKFTQLEEASSIGGISLDTEQIDVSALEDYLTQYAAGRQDTGGTWEIEFIMDPDKSVKQIKKLYEDSKAAKTTGLATWFPGYVRRILCYCRMRSRNSNARNCTERSSNHVHFSYHQYI